MRAFYAWIERKNFRLWFLKIFAFMKYKKPRMWKAERIICRNFRHEMQNLAVKAKVFESRKNYFRFCRNLPETNNLQFADFLFLSEKSKKIQSMPADIFRSLRAASRKFGFSTGKSADNTEKGSNINNKKFCPMCRMIFFVFFQSRRAENFEFWKISVKRRKPWTSWIVKAFPDSFSPLIVWTAMLFISNLLGMTVLRKVFRQGRKPHKISNK